jgi:hypothetical protein
MPQFFVMWQQRETRKRGLGTREHAGMSEQGRVEKSSDENFSSAWPSLLSDGEPRVVGHIRRRRKIESLTESPLVQSKDAAARRRCERRVLSLYAPTTVRTRTVRNDTLSIFYISD